MSYDSDGLRFEKFVALSSVNVREGIKIIGLKKGIERNRQRVEWRGGVREEIKMLKCKFI